MGARLEDVERGLNLRESNNDLTVVEIGCGNGRESEVLLSKVDNYIGVDVSASMLRLARERLPDANFVLSDVIEYDLPNDVDVIFAFASLLHLPKEAVSIVFKKASESLKTGGVLYVSLKRKDDYSSSAERDDYGERKFYYYNLSTLQDLVPQQFEVVYHDEQQYGSDDWITVAFKKL